MSKILGWFKTDKQEAPAANDAARTAREPRREQQQQRERRPDPRREHRRDRPRDERRPEHRQGGQQQRDPRQGGERRPDGRQGGQQQREPRQGGERRPDQRPPQQQQPQQPRPPRPEQGQPQGPHSAQGSAGGAPREGDEQRRRRRGGRDRHRGERRPDQTGGQLPQGLPVADQEMDTSVPAYLAKAPDANELRAREREMHLAAMREEEARQRAEAPVREQPREEAVRQESVRPEPAPAAAPVRVDPKVILENAGLQMVETNPHKGQAPAAEPEPVQLGRPRREKPRPAGEEPLVQIETKH